MGIIINGSTISKIVRNGVEYSKVIRNGVEIFSSAPPFDSGILENGIFSDSTGVNIPSGGWEVSSGTLNYLTGGAKKVRLSLSSDMLVGNTYNITFTISNASNARMAWYAGNQNELIEGNTDRGDGTYTISGYTHTVSDRNEISIVAQTSGGGTTFSIDNISVVNTNVYPYDNAVGANDIDSNDGWSNSSTFFANSIVSTDAGQNFSIAIEARSTSTSNTGYRFNRLPGLTVGTPYKATIRYKNTSTTTPVQHPMNSWREVSDVTYPSGTFSTGQWVEAEVLFTPNDPNNDAEMRFYPLANAAGGRTVGDLLEISSIIIEEYVFDSGLVLNGVFDDSSNLTLGSSWTVSGGTATYDAVEDDSQLKLDLTTLTDGNTYDLTFDVIGDGGRMEVKASGDNFLTAQTISSFTDRDAGTYTISFTANDDHTIIRFRGDNGSGGAFSLDNISLFDVTPEELFTGNAAADADGEVNSTAGFTTPGSLNFAVNSTDQNEGSHCVEIEATSDSLGFNRAEYDVPVEIGEQYNVSMWARELVGSDGRIQLWDGVTGWSTVTLTNTWTEYTATVTATATTMKMRFYPHNGSGFTGDKILLDNISITKI